MTPNFPLFALIFIVLYYAFISDAAEESMNVCQERNAKKIIYPNTRFHPDL